MIGENTQEIRANSFNNEYTSTQIGLQITNPIMPTVNISNPATMMIQIPPIMPSFAAVQSGHPVQPMPQPQQVTSMQTSTNDQCALVTLKRKGPIQVVTHRHADIAGFCNWCGRTDDQIGRRL